MSKPGKVNWRGLFAGGPDFVVIVEAGDGRVFGTDRFALWNLSAVCEAQGVDVPTPGRYRAMVKELRRTSADPSLKGDQLAALFDERCAGIEPDPENRLALSEYADSRHRPIVHTRTAEVRRIGLEWDAIPRLSTGAYWVACADWPRVNAAVHWGMYEQAPFGVVQLVGNAVSRDWNMPAHLAYAFASECGEVLHEVIAAAYPNHVR